MTDLEAEIESNPVGVGDFEVPVAIMDRTCGQKVNKETAELNSTGDLMKFPPSRRTHILLKCAWNILQARSAVAEKALTHPDSENHSYGSTGVRVCTQGSLVFLVEPWQELGQLATHTEFPVKFEFQIHHQ